MLEYRVLGRVSFDILKNTKTIELREFFVHEKQCQLLQLSRVVLSVRARRYLHHNCHFTSSLSHSAAACAHFTQFSLFFSKGIHARCSV